MNVVFCLYFIDCHIISNSMFPNLQVKNIGKGEGLNFSVESVIQ